MLAFNVTDEQVFNPKRHVEKILGQVAEGDVTIACWEPGQISPNHCHPNATEIYFCFEGGGVMRTPGQMIPIVPGSFVVHPPGELHEYENGPHRTILFRVRYGGDMSTRFRAWRGNADWKQTKDDSEYFGSTGTSQRQ
jgi:quercetin dioxygenase-like cupin family protein